MRTYTDMCMFIARTLSHVAWEIEAALIMLSGLVDNYKSQTLRKTSTRKRPLCAGKRAHLRTARPEYPFPVSVAITDADSRQCGLTLQVC